MSTFHSPYYRPGFTWLLLCPPEALHELTLPPRFTSSPWPSIPPRGPLPPPSSYRLYLGLPVRPPRAIFLPTDAPISEITPLLRGGRVDRIRYTDGGVEVWFLTPAAARECARELLMEGAVDAVSERVRVAVSQSGATRVLELQRCTGRWEKCLLGALVERVRWKEDGGGVEIVFASIAEALDARRCVEGMGMEVAFGRDEVEWRDEDGSEGAG